MRKASKMKWPPAVKIWMERAEYDFETARAMYKTGRYLYVVFMCQQAVEKTLKAILAFQHKEIKPIHHLPKLAELAGLLHEFREETLTLVENLSGYYLNARYKETIEALVKAIDKKEAREYLSKTESLILWLTQKMKPLP
ncbi:MAG: HEPN domain-containing protein [bacterium]